VSKVDLIIAALLLISAAIGYMRGAVREVAAMLALVAAAFLAIFGLPAAAPFAHHLIHSRWLAALAALVVIFLVTYGLLRLIGAGIAQRVQQTHVVGALDRFGGLGIGVVRGLVVLGGLYLMFNAATPEDLRPRWITGSASWPVAERMGRLLTELAPKGLDVAGRLKPAFDRAVGSGSGRSSGSGDRSTTASYDARERGEIDNLVEQSR
jgi:membrane protein required for colicin V production